MKSFPFLGSKSAVTLSYSFMEGDQVFIQKAFPCIQRASNWAVSGYVLSGQTITAAVKFACLLNRLSSVNLLGGERKQGCIGIHLLLNGVWTMSLTEPASQNTWNMPCAVSRLCKVRNLYREKSSPFKNIETSFAHCAGSQAGALLAWIGWTSAQTSSHQITNATGASSAEYGPMQCECALLLWWKESLMMVFTVWTQNSNCSLREWLRMKSLARNIWKPGMDTGRKCGYPETHPLFGGWLGLFGDNLILDLICFFFS